VNLTGVEIGSCEPCVISIKLNTHDCHSRWQLKPSIAKGIHFLLSSVNFDRYLDTTTSTNLLYPPLFSFSYSFRHHAIVLDINFDTTTSIFTTPEYPRYSSTFRPISFLYIQSIFRSKEVPFEERNLHWIEPFQQLTLDSTYNSLLSLQQFEAGPFWRKETSSQINLAWFGKTLPKP
jgi:hypothetical protein